jgi:hypothetical protein
LQIILLHEFAHLQRRDDWTNLIQKLVRTVFIFHPAVWWIEKRLSIEREMACDDAVLAATHNPRAYAECLVSLAERNFVRRSLALAQAAISRACETRARLARILDADTPHATKIFKPALGLMAGLLAACLVALPGAPRLVTFENGRPQNSVAATGNLANAVPALSPTNLDPNDVTATGSALAVPAVYRLSNGPGLRSDVAKFKPAKFHQPSTLQKPARKKLTAKQVPVTNRNNEEVSHTVLAADTIPAPIAPAPEFFFVMQTADFDQHGSVVVSLTVWKVTFAAPDAAPMNANQIQQILARFI